MKHYIFLLFIFTSFFTFANNHHNPIVFQVVSEELSTQNGVLPIKVKLKFGEDSIRLNGDILGALGFSENFTLNEQSLENLFFEGDSTEVTFTIQYPTNQLPYYPKEFRVNIPYIHDGKEKSLSVLAKVYFTPYGTVEIWNETDFEISNRIWLVGDESEKTRINVDKNSIPTCTLPINYKDSLSEDEITYEYIDGLAYAIPRKLTEEELLPPPFVCEQWTYTKTIKGRVMGNFKNDITDVFQSLPLRGLNVEIRRKRTISGANNTIATVRTDNNGYFTYNLNEKLCGKDHQEIFIEVVAKNEEHDIRSYYTFIGLTAASTKTDIKKMYRSNNGGELNFGEITASSAHKAVHLANNAWKFCTNNGVSLEDGLVIRIDDDFNTFFLPNKIKGYNREEIAMLTGAKHGNPFGDLISAVTANIIFRNPHIFASSDDLESESTIYHEFGHFVMWNVQNTKWVDVLTGSFASHGWETEANSRIAWTEGWADAFMGMVDGYYANDDGEYGLDYSDIYDIRSRDSDYIFNNGIHSSYNVTCAIFDLWDGEFLPQNSYNNWSDYGQDLLSLPFKMIVKPMENYAPDDVGEYFERLLPYLTDKDRSEAGNILRINHVTADALNYKFFNSLDPFLPNHSNDHGHGNLASGNFLKKNVEFNNVGENFKTTHTIHYYRLNNSAIVSNGGVYTDPIVAGPRIKNLTIKSASDQKSAVKFIRRANISAINDGKLIVGGDNGSNPCSLLINDGAFLQLRDGGSLIVKKGSELIIGSQSTFKTSGVTNIKVEDGGKLIIEEGAYVCLSNQTQFDFEGGLKDLTLNSSLKSVSEFSKLKTGTGIDNSFDCNSFEDFFAHDYGVALVQNKVLDCSTGHFEFEITNIESLPYDAKICWNFPEHWTVNSFTNCSRWAYPIGGSVTSWGNKDFVGGEVRVVISSSLGIKEFSYSVDSKLKPTLSSYKGDVLTLCQDNSQGDLVVTASNSGGNNNSTFQFQWNNQWGLNHQIINTSNTSKMQFKSPQWSVDPQYVYVTATNNEGCVSEPLGLTIKPKVYGWTAAEMWTKNTFQFRALNTTLKTANIVNEQKGNIYYVGEDNKLYTYTYDADFGAWRNYALPKNNPITDAAGPILMNEPNAGNRTIYYVTTFGEIRALQASNSSAEFELNTNYNAFGNMNEPKNTVLTTVLNQNNLRDVIYSNGTNLYIKNGGILKRGDNTPVTFAGKNIIHKNGILYYRTADGVMAQYNYATKQEIKYPNQNIDANSDLAMDDYGNIWFTKWSQMCYFDTPSNNFNSTNAYNSSGKISINKETGVVYFVDNQTRFAQLFYSVNNFNWNVNVIGHSNASSGGQSIHFSNPNLFFTNSSTYIWNLFYYLLDCQPAIFKVDEDAMKNPEQHLDLVRYQPEVHEETTRNEFKISPIPVNDYFTLSYNVPNNGNVNVVIYDASGRLVANLKSNYEEKGAYKEDFYISLVSGVYLVELSVDNNPLSIQKIIVHR